MIRRLERSQRMRALYRGELLIKRIIQKIETRVTIQYKSVK